MVPQAVGLFPSREDFAMPKPYDASRPRTDDLKNIGVPVLVMHSKDDQIVPYAGLGRSRRSF